MQPVTSVERMSNGTARRMVFRSCRVARRRAAAESTRNVRSHVFASTGRETRARRPTIPPLMSRFWSFTIFVVFAVAVLYGMHRYVWVRFVRDTRLSRGWRIAARLALIVLALLIPIAFLFGRRELGEGRVNVAIPAYVWLGVLFYTVLVLAVIDTGKLLHRL